MKALDNKVAIVTGGSRGIGKFIALELARNGAKTVINYNSNSDAALEVVKEIEGFGGEAFASQADVSDSAQAKVLVEEAIRHFGKVDILVNNAGITRDRSFLKLTEENWRKVIDVNLNSAFNMTSAVIPQMVEQKYGRIVNISSIIGQSGNIGQTNYAASKAGLIGFTKSLALEMANKGITVNAICPGFIETEMVAEIPAEILEKIIAKVPQRRLGQPQEIARAVLYLVTDGDYITGQQLNINGGLYM